MLMNACHRGATLRMAAHGHSTYIALMRLAVQFQGSVVENVARRSVQEIDQEWHTYGGPLRSYRRFIFHSTCARGV